MNTLLYKARAKNRRIEIILISHNDVEPYYVVKTKRLLSFKDRNIAETHIGYSIETFTLLSQLMLDYQHEPIIAKQVEKFTDFEQWELRVLAVKNE